MKINFNKIYQKYLIGIFLFFCFLFPLNVQAQCNGKGYTIVYVNGIFTPTEKLADADRNKLSDKYKEYFDISNINFITGYNPSHLAGLGDLVQAASQILENPISDFDLKTILQRIHPQINTKKILLVGHSQGTFYTNELYNYLINNGIPKESIAVYNVATPADFVAGNGLYLTSQNDKVVNNVRNVAKNVKAKQPLPQNINIPLNEQNDPKGHSFSSVYLNSAPKRIISEINNVLKNLDNTQQVTNTSDSGCFNLPDQNFSYKTQKLIYLVADPVSNGIVKAGVVTYNGVAFAGNVLSTGVAVVLDPIFNLFQKKTVANIHNFQALIGGIGQLFNRQDGDSPSSLQELSEQQSQQLEDALNELQNSKNLITEPINSEEQSESLNQEDIEQNQELEKPQEEIEKDKELEEEKIPESQYFASDVVINELIPNPADDQNELIELYNRTDKSIDLTNWTIEDNTAHPKNLKGKIISSHSWLALNGGNDFSFQLNNSGDTTILKYNGNLIDQIGYGDFNDGNIHDNPDTPSKGESLIRYPDGQDKNQDDQDFLITATPTPGLANLFTEQVVLISKTLNPDKTINNISYQSFQSQDVVINEIAWAGTKADSTDEWIEFYNNLDKPISLAGWRLKAADGSPNILLTGEISAHGYWLLERTDDEVIKNISADQIYSGVLEDSGETLELIDGNGNRIDFINQENGWLGGGNETKASMERINSTLTGVDTNNWQTNNGQNFLWFDAKYNQILGTPKYKNSQQVVKAQDQHDKSYLSYKALDVVINEIDWTGTKADTNDEWIELYNNLDQEIDLSGWTLKAEDGSPDIVLSGKIAGRDFFILERTDDEAIKNVTADQIYSGVLGNSGEDLELRDKNNNLIDEVDCTDGWFFGDNTTKATMERIDSLVSGSLKDNWQTAYFQDQTAQDTKNNLIFGSPKNKNTGKPEGNTKDTIPPEIKLTQKPATSTNLTIANFEFSINEEGNFLCKIDDQNLESCSSPKIYSNLAEGNHIFYIKAVDQADNFSEITYSWTIDLTGLISSPTTSGIFNFSTWPNQINGIASSNVSSTDLLLVEVKIQNKSENKYLGYTTSTIGWIDEPTWLETVLNENNWHFDLPVSLLTELPDGLYSISSQATDLVGNIQNTTSTTEFIFDSISPEKINNLKTENLGGLNLKLSWDKAIDNLSGIDHYEVNWGHNIISTIANHLELNVEDGEECNFQVRVIDRAGNSGDWSEPISYFIKLPSVVISEVQITGQTVNDEFIELYNPTEAPIDLTGYILKKKTSGGSESNLIVNSRFVDKIIQPKGFLLLVPEENYLGSVTPDIRWPKSYSLAPANTLILYNPEEKIIDKVGWGQAIDFETVAASEPIVASQSIERNNFQDTDNNFNDFIVQAIPSPISSKGLWLNGWQKRKLLVIDNTQNNNDLIDFEINIGIDYESEMNHDFSDIRFTDSDKTTLLNYGWDINDDGTDQKQNEYSATAVVKIPFIPKRAQKIIYLYYDNPSALPVANLETTLTWFDHFTTDRSSEYENFNIEWDTTDSAIYAHYGWAAKIYPKDLNIKNALIKTKFYQNDGGYFEDRYMGLEYRYIDDNNLFRISGRSEINYDDPLSKGIRWEKIINGTKTLKKLDDNADVIRKEWQNITISSYEGEHNIQWKSANWDLSWSDIENQQNVAGNIGIWFWKYNPGGCPTPKADYFYIRQNTKSWPTVFEVAENYQPIILGNTPYLEIPGWEKRKEIIITNNNTKDLVNFEVNVNISHDSVMNPDFSDIRFTDSDKTTLLNYGWDINDDGTDQKQNEYSATAVVKIPLIPASSETKIYMYYGNKSASTVANLETTLTWFDHFKTDRSSEYEVFNMLWNTSNSQIVSHYGWANSIYPKNLNIKDAIIKTYYQLGGGGQFEDRQIGLQYRYTDDNNFWRIYGEGPRNYNPPEKGIYWKRVISGSYTIKNSDISQWFSQSQWHNLKITLLDINHHIEWLGETINENWSDIDTYQNVAGRVMIWFGKLIPGGCPDAYADYFYIRQNAS
ncbi:MAG: DUF2341 domain-containing protein, partial [Patescibacteria group bacterium]|nr:DUF2341 domain-containing protein [Patescibacteria group bacterium]